MAKTKTAVPEGVGYSYIRFSHPDQAKGDSFRRQIEKRDAWLRTNRVTLDTSLSMEDRGVSGFTGEHRENADRHALAAFLELVRQGRIGKGSYLIVESLDRLSREHIRPALTLLLNLIDAGIRVVQLLPVEAVYDDRVEPMQLMQAIMELSRGNSESQMKSERVGGAWREKKRRAAADGEPLTARCPAWLRLSDGRWEVLDPAAEAVRRIFRMVVDGHGIMQVVKRLNGESVPPIARGTYWAKSYVAKILDNRAVVGEYQPHAGRGRKRHPDGPPIPNYYPVIVDEQQYFAAQAALSGRRTNGGRLGKGNVNLFAHLIHDARDGSPMHTRDPGRGQASKLLFSYHAEQGMGQSVSFPLAIFERAVLTSLREIDPREILPQKDPTGEQVMALSGRLQAVEEQIGRIKAKLLDSPDIDALADVVRTLETQQKALAEQLNEARKQAASPLAESWGQARSLIDALDQAPDAEDVRVRLRASIRRVIESIWLLAVRRGRNRVAAVQLWFRDGEHHRDYLIYYRPSHANGAEHRPTKWWSRSLADVAAPGGLDLRNREDAARLEQALQVIDTTA